MMSSPHSPVMIDEVLEWLAPRQGGTYIDATFGAGGYSRRLLQHSACHILAIDRDPSVEPFAEAISAALTPPSTLQLYPAPFSQLASVVEQAGSPPIDGIMFDFGVSSMQLDQAERGFSFMQDGPLDMRMGQHGKSAYDLVNQADEEAIADVLYQFGDERRSRAIARRIGEARRVEPIATTAQLVKIVHRVLGPVSGGINSATRTFQAIRIWVNDELDEIRAGLAAAEAVLRPGGRMVTVSFHSLEDQIVKQFFHDKSGKYSQGSRHEPLQAAPSTPATLEVLTKRPIAPSAREVTHNPRARSAKLRAARKKQEK